MARIFAIWLCGVVTFLFLYGVPLISLTFDRLRILKKRGSIPTIGGFEKEISRSEIWREMFFELVALVIAALFWPLVLAIVIVFA